MSKGTAGETGTRGGVCAHALSAKPFAAGARGVAGTAVSRDPNGRADRPAESDVRRRRGSNYRFYAVRTAAAAATATAIATSANRPEPPPPPAPPPTPPSTLITGTGCAQNRPRRRTNLVRRVYDVPYTPVTHKGLRAYVSTSRVRGEPVCGLPRGRATPLRTHTPCRRAAVPRV